MSRTVVVDRRIGSHRRIHVLDAFLAHWLTVGALVLLAVPPTHWHNAWIGWLPYWLVLVPAVPLARHGLRPARRANS